ncbi:hypothetical protein Tco_0576560 [Tanacetum coccineum]
MEEDNAEDMEVKVLSSMWPEDIDAAGKKFNVEKPGGDQDLLKGVTFIEEPTIVDFKHVPKKRNDVIIQDERLEIDDECDINTVKFWKQNALHLEKMFEASVQREQILLENLEESIENIEKQSSPVEELSQILKRVDNFLHLVL